MELTFDTLKAHTFALKAHGQKDYGKTDDGRRVPYSVHLTYVVGIAEKFIHYIEPNHRAEIIQACWLHDVWEDCGEGAGTLRKHFGDFVMHVVYGVTNEIGLNRKDKMEKTLPKTAKNRYSVFVKLCDRIVNLKYSKMTGSGQYEMYCREAAMFKEYLYREGEYPDMWVMIDELCRVEEAIKS